jgi:hypothetical protein
LQQRVAGLVTLRVVERLETIDVDERENETAARPARAFDLAIQLTESEVSRPSARQLVGRGDFEIVLRLDLGTTGLLTLLSCCGPVGRSPAAVVGSPATVLGCLGPVNRCSSTVALGTRENLVDVRVGVAAVPRREVITSAGGLIASLGGAIARLGLLIPMGSGLQPRCGRLVSQP